MKLNRILRQLTFLFLLLPVINSCSTDDETIPPNVVANFTNAGQSDGTGVVRFSNTSMNADSYFWDFGDNRTSTEINPIHNYEEGGEYEVELIATDVKGNSDSDSKTITIEKRILPSTVEFFITTPDQSSLLELSTNEISKITENNNSTITVSDQITYQEMDGFGFALTGGSALHLNTMAASQRAILLNELFGANGLRISYLRVSVGASDLDVEPFSYNDLPSGQTQDLNLDHFSIAKDQENLIPILKEILAINSNIKIMAAPWSAPSWMKTGNSTIGGSLKPEYYSVYSEYLVQYIQAYEGEGIPIDALSVQNEPQHDSNNPSMRMESNEMATFVKDHLGPEFTSANITTKIIVWDHNADNVNYPISIFDDQDANEYIEGSAFHLYSGSINSLSQVHSAYPDKNLYFTEQ